MQSLWSVICSFKHESQQRISLLLKKYILFFFLQEFFQDGSKPENVGVYNLSKGVNRFCLSKPGELLSSDLSLAKV